MSPPSSVQCCPSARKRVFNKHCRWRSIVLLVLVCRCDSLFLVGSRIVADGRSCQAEDADMART